MDLTLTSKSCRAQKYQGSPHGSGFPHSPTLHFHLAGAAWAGPEAHASR